MYDPAACPYLAIDGRNVYTAIPASRRGIVRACEVAEHVPS